MVDILNDIDSRTYEDCILAIRKKAVDVEGNLKDNCVIHRVAGNKTRNKYQGGQKEPLSLKLPQKLSDNIQGKEKDVSCTYWGRKGPT